MRNLFDCPDYLMVKTLRYVAAFLVFFLFSFDSHASSQYSTRVWQTEEGLPHNNVQAILQTEDGYLWVGTQNGLARFNGIKFSVFDTNTTPQLQSANIMALCEGRDHSLWIGTKGGLVCFKEGSFLRPNQPRELERSVVRALFQASDGTIWIGTPRGVFLLKGDSLERFSLGKVNPSWDVRAIAEDLNHSIYLGTDKGVRLLRGGTLSAVDDKRGMTSLRTMSRDHVGNMWFGANRALIRIDPKHPTAQIVVPGASHAFVSALLESPPGRMWVGTYGGLNYSETNGTFVEIKNHGEPFDLVNAIAADREGNIWVGDKNGLTQLRPEFFSTYTTQQGLRHNNVSSVQEDQAGALWVGTWGGGLAQIRNDHVEALTPTGSADDVTHMLVAALFVDRSQDVWFSANDTGLLYRLHEGTMRSFGATEGYVDKVAKVIRQDRTGVYWIGTRTALSRFDGHVFKRFTKKEGLAGNVIQDILEDKDGSLWIATQTGLSRRRDGKFTSFNHTNGLPYDVVNCLHQDSGGLLWLGTSGGLVRFKDGTFTAITLAQGASQEIYSLLEDDYGRFWMSGPSGVSSVVKASLNAALDRRESRVPSTSYGKADGMLTASCSGYAQASAWKAADGRLWFSTAQGLSVIDPKITKRSNEVPPPVVVEEVLADKQRIEGQTANLRPRTFNVPPGRGEVEFHFAALDYTAPDQNRFKYKLEGLDSDWVDADTRHAAFYNNIPPGHYTFRVIACNNSGVWNSTGALVQLTLQPHFWQTRWFIGTIAFMSIGFVGGTARYLTRKRLQRKFIMLEQQHMIEKERTRIARDMHDDLGSRLTGIMMLSDLADSSEGPAHRDQLKKVSQASRELVQSLDALVWAVDPGKDTLEKMAVYISEFAERYLDNSSIRCRVEMPDEFPPLSVSSEVRHNLFLVVKEALNNAVKHSRASEIGIRLSLRGGTLELSVVDNGIGFVPADTSARGNGLGNMRKRVEALGGQLVTCSQPGKGTRINLELPLDS